MRHRLRRVRVWVDSLSHNRLPDSTGESGLWEKPFCKGVSLGEIQTCKGFFVSSCSLRREIQSLHSSAKSAIVGLQKDAVRKMPRRRKLQSLGVRLSEVLPLGQRRYR